MKRNWRQWAVSGCIWLVVVGGARAGDLNVVGNVNVASNLTATSVSLGGQTRSNWPSGLAAC
jgi:hypothetical protein